MSDTTLGVNDSNGGTKNVDNWQLVNASGETVIRQQVVTHSSLVNHSSLGRSFIGSSDNVSASLGQSIRATLTNPASSGKNVILYALTATSESTGGLVVGDVFINPTTNTPSTSYTPFNSLIGGPAAVTELKVDAGAAMTGGTATDLHIGISEAGRNQFELPAPIIIGQGVSLGLNIPIGALSATDGLFAVYFLEFDA